MTSPIRAEESRPVEAVSPMPRGLDADRVQPWFNEALAAYERGEFEIAAHLFRAVYEAAPAPAVLYDLAQAERRAGQCSSALTHYEEYVRLESAQAPTDIVEKMDEMRACVASTRAEPTLASTSSQPTPPTRTGEGQGARRSGTRTALRAVAYGSAAGAIVSAALGTVYLLRANAASDHLSALDSGQTWGDEYAAYEDALGRANAAALGFFIVSGVMAATSTTAFLLQGQGGSPSGGRSSLRLGTSSRGLGLSCAVLF
jgi:tetratricopeptide (TPR) repeat protein